MAFISYLLVGVTAWAVWCFVVLQPASRLSTAWGPRWLAHGASWVLFTFACSIMNFSHNTEEMIQKGILGSGRQYLIVWHPHGNFTITALYFLSHFWAKCYPEKGWLVWVAPLLLRIPGLSEYLILCGGRSGRSSTFNDILAEGKTLAVQPGGLVEQVNTDDKKEVAYFPARLGFIRAAIKNGVPLLPLYAFGENQLYATAPWVRNLNKWFYKTLHSGSLVVLGQFGIPNSPIFPNPGMLPIYNSGIHVRYGEPVEVGAPDANPSDEKVHEVFKKYTSALQKLFDAHKNELLPTEVAAAGLTVIWQGAESKQGKSQ